MFAFSSSSSHCRQSQPGFHHLNDNGDNPLPDTQYALPRSCARRESAIINDASAARRPTPDRQRRQCLRLSRIFAHIIIGVGGGDASLFDPTSPARPCGNGSLFSARSEFLLRIYQLFDFSPEELLSTSSSVSVRDFNSARDVPVVLSFDIVFSQVSEYLHWRYSSVLASSFLAHPEPSPAYVQYVFVHFIRIAFCFCLG